MGPYRVCGLALESNVPLPELPRGRNGRIDLRFTQLPPARPRKPPAGWFHRWSFPNGRPWLLFGRVGGGFLLRFNRLADFRVSADGRSVSASALPGVPDDTVRHLLLDQVVPLLLARSGDLVLHASAAEVGSGAVAFLGRAGRGKSTLAASFGRAGSRVVSDDCLLVEVRGGRVRVRTSYPGVRLWDDARRALFGRGGSTAAVAHYTSKKRVKGIAFRGGAVSLRRLYLLEAGRRLEIVPLSAREGFAEICRHAFVLDVEDRARMASSFDAAARVALRVPVRRLRYPRDLARLGEVRRAILADLSRT